MLHNKMSKNFWTGPQKHRKQKQKFFNKKREKIFVNYTSDRRVITRIHNYKNSIRNKIQVTQNICNRLK